MFLGDIYAHLCTIPGCHYRYMYPSIIFFYHLEYDTVNLRIPKHLTNSYESTL